MQLTLLKASEYGFYFKVQVSAPVVVVEVVLVIIRCAVLQMLTLLHVHHSHKQLTMMNRSDTFASDA